MSSDEKKSYELGFLLNEENLSPVKRLLEKHSAANLSEGSLVKVNLAYPIKKQGQAFFGYLRFELEGPVAELKKDLKLEPTVLRHLLIKVPSAAPEEVPTGRPASSLKPPVRRKEVKTGAPLLTNEALEKKIEEILQ